MAAEVFLDARLAVAAVYALLGYVPSARAQAQGASPPAMLEDARASLLRALEQPLRKTIEVGALPARPLGPDARRLLDRLRSTPEPSLALGAPFWLLPDRGAIITRLVREGRRAVASSLRNLLDRPDVRQDVEPFWLLHEADTKALQQLALRLAPRLATEATERQCLALLERWCRECSPEERVIGEGHGGQG
jgi:hypothetical protein